MKRLTNVCVAVFALAAMSAQAQSGQWQDADLTALTGGALSNGSDMRLVFDPAWGGMRTHYVAQNQHVHELFLNPGGQWQDADLTAITGGPLADGFGIASAFDPVWNGVRTHYVSASDFHVHELFLNPGGQWQDADLTVITGGPISFRRGMAMRFDPNWNGMRTHYVAQNQHVHELFLNNPGGQWQDADLTAITGGPLADGFGMASAFDPSWNGMRTHYVAQDLHVHELFLNGSQWQDADLTAITGGPVANGSAIASAFDPSWNGMRTHYVTQNQHVHELFLNGSQWQDADLTAITGGALANAYEIAIAFDPIWNGMRTHYITPLGNQHVHELFLNPGGQWQDADLSAITGAPLASGPIFMAFDPSWNGMRTHYLISTNHVHELFLNR